MVLHTFLAIFPSVMLRFTLVAGALAEALNGIPALVDVTNEDLNSTPTLIDWSP